MIADCHLPIANFVTKQATQRNWQLAIRNWQYFQESSRENAD
jgi:hypothetical protein